MSVRELVILGSGCELATPERYLNGYILRWDDEGILMDPAEGSQRRMIHVEATATSLTRVFISSFSGDACLGLAGLTQRISLDRVPHAVEVCFPASGRVFYDRLRKASAYHAAAKLAPREMAEDTVLACTKKLVLETKRLEHPRDVFGLRLSEPSGRTMLPDRLRELGVQGPRIKQLQLEGFIELEGRRVELDDVSTFKPGHAVAYVPPTRPCAAARALLADADLALIHVSHGNAEVQAAAAAGCMSAGEAGRLAREAGAHRVVITGFRPGGAAPDRLAEEVAEAFWGAVTAAEDGARIPIPRRKKPQGS